MRRIRSHLTYANVMVTLLAFVVLAGGAAYAANTVFSSDIVNGEVNSADIGNRQIQSVDVRDDTLPGGGLNGDDIANNVSGSDAINADLLDGFEAGAFTKGRGSTALANRLIDTPNFGPGSVLLSIPGLGEVRAQCFDEGPELYYWNDTDFPVDVWVLRRDGVFQSKVQPAHSGPVSMRDGASLSLGRGDDPGPRRIATLQAFAFQEFDGWPCGSQAQGTLWTSE